MSDKIRVNYPALEDMAKHLEMVADAMSQTAGRSKLFSQQMQDGALVGDAGQTYCEALAIFNDRVTKLLEKYREVAKEIRQAATDMQSADTQAGNQF
jgi:WXG100 family type VII secretion target